MHVVRQYVSSVAVTWRLALVLLSSVACALTAAPTSMAAKARLIYAVDGRPTTIEATGKLTIPRGTQRRVTILLQERRGRGSKARWRNRGRTVVAARRRSVKFRVVWRRPPLEKKVHVRVVALYRSRTIATSHVKAVTAGDPGTVFYSGEGNAGAGEAPGAAWRLVAEKSIFRNNFDGVWTAGPCDPTAAASVPRVAREQAITQLAGYSLGRLGPIYFLKKATDRWADIDYILLLDPGGVDDLSGSCDSNQDIAPWHLLDDWLASRSTNRLVIMSGKLTSSAEHSAIRAFYLREMSDVMLKQQVLVCDADLNHDDFMKDPDGYGWMVGGHAPHSCPAGSKSYTVPKHPWPQDDTPSSPGEGTGAPQVPAVRTVQLNQGPAAPAGFWYAVRLGGFVPGSTVAVSCRDSVDPQGFRNFSVVVDGTGSASANNGCYSGAASDHWVVANGVESNHVSWAGGSVSPPTPPTPGPRSRVTPYNNYGSANAGRAMCRGNPGRPESMPGGTVTQTFTVPSGVASLDAATVQIDPDSSVVAHAALAVNGGVRATADATAAGDTNFGFGAVGVAAGDQVTLKVTFTATFGKLTTVYTAGAPGGVFSASNSCPDGAPSLTTSTTGLRATVSGWSS